MNDDQLRQFAKNGYVCSRGAVASELILPVERAIELLFRAHARAGEKDIHTIAARLNQEDQQLLYRLYLTLTKSFALHELRTACLSFAREVLSEGVLIDLAPGILMGLPRDERLTYDWHQEIVYHRELPDTLHFWLPLIVPSTSANGTMSVLAGSHRLGELPFTRKEKLVSNSTTSLVPHGIDEIRRTCPEVIIEGQPGDLVMLHSYVIHRSNLNHSNETRFNASFRVSSVARVPSSYDFSVKD